MKESHDHEKRWLGDVRKKMCNSRCFAECSRPKVIVWRHIRFRLWSDASRAEEVQRSQRSGLIAKLSVSFAFPCTTIPFGRCSRLMSVGGSNAHTWLSLPNILKFFFENVFKNFFENVLKKYSEFFENVLKKF